MQLKNGLQDSTQDFYYDLIDGGYLKPEVMCERKEDADKVIEAIKVIEDFKASCEEQIEGFIQ